MSGTDAPIPAERQPVSNGPSLLPRTYAAQRLASFRRHAWLSAAAAATLALPLLLLLFDLPAALATAAILLAALLTFWRPLIGVLLVVAIAFVFPFGVPPVQLFGLHPSLLDAALTIALVAWWLPRMASFRPRLQAGPLGLTLLLFLCVLLLAFALGLERTPPERARMFLKLVNSILFGLTVLNAVRTAAELRLLVQVLIVAASVAAAAAVVLYLLPPATDLSLRNALGPAGYPTGESIVRLIAGSDVRRATGTAVDPNVLGGMLAIALPLVAAQWVAQRPLLPRWLLTGSAALLVAGIVLSYSRGSWLSAAAGVAFVAWVRYPRASLLGGLALVFLLLPQGRIIIDRITGAALLADRATVMRLGEYKDALILIPRHPFLGVGFGSPPDPDLYVGVSSIYLLLAEQAGLIGLGAFLAILAQLYRWALPRCLRVRDEAAHRILVGGLAAVSAGLCAGLVDHYFLNLQIPHTVALFWLMVGLTVKAGLVEEASIGRAGRGGATRPALAPRGPATSGE